MNILCARLCRLLTRATLGIALLCGGARAAEAAHFEGDAMHTHVTLDVPECEPPACARAWEAVRAAFERVEVAMNEWREGSPIARVNAAAGDHAVEVPADVFDLVERGIELARLTGGAFDITWAALWPLWRFRGKDLAPPPVGAVAAALDHIGWRRVVLDARHHTVFLPDAGMKMGVGGISKGESLRIARELLRRQGIRSAAISAGGQILVLGAHGERPWRVGIRDPRSSPTDFFAVLEVRDTSVSTSGDYERYFVYRGKLYHHILDPRTGWPARGLRSATVVCDDPVLADGLSTACVVAGPRACWQFLREAGAKGGVLVTAQGTVLVSAGLTEAFRLVHPPRNAAVPAP